MTQANRETRVGRTEARSDALGATPVAALSATLDRDDPPPVPLPRRMWAGGRLALDATATLA
jgi:hypothetical protein